MVKPCLALVSLLARVYVSANLAPEILVRRVAGFCPKMRKIYRLNVADAAAAAADKLLVGIHTVAGGGGIAVPLAACKSVDLSIGDTDVSNELEDNPSVGSDFESGIPQDRQGDMTEKAMGRGSMAGNVVDCDRRG
jgi:hypothetical protein